MHSKKKKSESLWLWSDLLPPYLLHFKSNLMTEFGDYCFSYNLLKIQIKYLMPITLAPSFHQIVYYLLDWMLLSVEELPPSLSYTSFNFRGQKRFKIEASVIIRMALLMRTLRMCERCTANSLKCLM